MASASARERLSSLLRLDRSVAIPVALGSRVGVLVVQDRPDARELLAAVARWLQQDLRPTLQGEQRFSALVAANCCAILAREWAAEGPGPPHRTEQLRARGGHPGGSL